MFTPFLVSLIEETSHIFTTPFPPVKTYWNGFDNAIAQTTSPCGRTAASATPLGTAAGGATGRGGFCCLGGGC